jgi:hypothetical protein
MSARRPQGAMSARRPHSSPQLGPGFGERCFQSRQPQNVMLGARHCSIALTCSPRASTRADHPCYTRRRGRYTARSRGAIVPRRTGGRAQWLGCSYWCGLAEAARTTADPWPWVRLALPRLGRSERDALGAERRGAGGARRPRERVPSLGAEIEVDKPRALDYRAGLCFQQSTRNSASPQVDVLLGGVGHGLLDDDVGDLEPTTGFEHAEDFAVYRLFVGAQTDDAVGDGDVRVSVG